MSTAIEHRPEFKRVRRATPNRPGVWAAKCDCDDWTGSGETQAEVARYHHEHVITAPHEIELAGAAPEGRRHDLASTVDRLHPTG